MSIEKIGSIRGHRVSWDDKTKEVLIDGYIRLEYKAEKAAIALELADEYLKTKGK